MRKTQIKTKKRVAYRGLHIPQVLRSQVILTAYSLPDGLLPVPLKGFSNSILEEYRRKEGGEVKRSGLKDICS